MNIQDTFKTNIFLDVLSDLTLSMLKNTILIPREENTIYSYLPFFNNIDHAVKNFGELFHIFKKVKIEHNIIGTDASIVPIAESESGYVFGLRGAAVKYVPSIDKYEVYIEGPIILHLTSETLKFLKNYINNNLLHRNTGLLSYTFAKRIILSVYEWLFIKEVVLNNSDSIIIVDGAIEPIYLSASFYHDIISSFKKTGNYLIGFSKRSKYMKYFSEIVSTLLILGIEGMVNIKLHGKKYSKIFIGLLKKGGYPFRIDILKDVPLNVINEVYSSHLNIVGYPAVLKEAHIFSKLNRKDSLTLRMILAKNGVRIKKSEPYRKLVLGILENLGDVDETL